MWKRGAWDQDIQNTPSGGQINLVCACNEGYFKAARIGMKQLVFPPYGSPQDDANLTVAIKMIDHLLALSVVVSEISCI